MKRRRSSIGPSNFLKRYHSMTPGWTIVIKSISSQRFSPSVSRIAIEKERERERQREREREREMKGERDAGRERTMPIR